MAIQKNRVKTLGVGGNLNDPFVLGAPVPGFSSFVNGLTTYIVLAVSGEWEISKGVVSGSSLSRGAMEENHLGTLDHVNFTGLTIQIGQVLSVAFINSLETDVINLRTDVDNLNVDFQTQIDGKEDAFAKNSAFNKNYGVGNNSVCAGDDIRLSDARTPLSHEHDDIYYTETEIDALRGADRKLMLDDVPPDPPYENGQEWTSTISGITYTWYASGNGQWVGNG